MKYRIGVIMGGNSTERHTSLKTGTTVLKALERKGYDVVGIDADSNLVENIKNSGINLAYVALQGKNNGDGTVQAILQMLGIPFTGCGVLTSAIINDKIATKKILLYEGIVTPRFITISKREIDKSGMGYALSRIENEIGLPALTKAPTQGSSIGISFIFKKEELQSGLEYSLKYDDEILVEEMVKGTEITSAVIGNENPVVLPSVEITCVKGVYDVHTKGNPKMRTHTVPARISAEDQKKVEETSLRIYKALNCKGYARIDYIIDKNGIPVTIEVNAVPGMADTSLFPRAAAAIGIGLDDLVERIVMLAAAG
jgi:D-alanine--D-alanine ligase